MKKTVKFQGLSVTPADADSADGQMGSLLNLIPEDGALKPLYPDGQPLFTIGESCGIEAVHKSNSFEDAHYIIHCVDNGVHSWAYKWNNGSVWLTTPITLQHPDAVNKVVAIGNLLCFVESDTIEYAYWKGTSYTVFSREDLTYSVSIHSPSDTDNSRVSPDDGTYGAGERDDVAFREYHRTRPDFKLTPIMAECTEEDFWTAMGYTAAPDIGQIVSDSNLHRLMFTAKGSRSLWNILDAYIQKEIEKDDKNYFKYTSFGVAAVRLYDGTHINVSNIFCLHDPYPERNMICNFEGNRSYMWTAAMLHRHAVTVTMDTQGLEDVIAGVDIYLTPPVNLFDVDIPTSIKWEDSETWEFTFEWNIASRDKMMDLFDNLLFYKSVSLETSEINRGHEKEKVLMRVSEASEALALADFATAVYGAGTAYSYNNRLNLGNIKRSWTSPFEIRVTQDFSEHRLSDEDRESSENSNDCITDNSGFWERVEHVHGATYGGGTSWTIVVTSKVKLHNKMLRHDASKAEMLFGQWPHYGPSDECDCVIKVTVDNPSGSTSLYYYGAGVQYPLQPVMMFPDSAASHMQVWLKFGSEVWTRKFDLRKSDTKGMSYSLTYGTIMGSTHIRYNMYNISQYNAKTGALDEGTTMEGWTESTPDIFAAEKAKADSGSAYTTERSLVRVSEAENPLVFPPANSVNVGSGRILAFASNTRPVSQGQFGEAPLYVFTDECVWPLMVSSDGTYHKLGQPATRDVVLNTASITPIDDAVLFTSSRGIMILEGSSAKCISEILNGKPFIYPDMHEDTAPLVLQTGEIPEEAVRYADFLHEFLDNAQMIYDYPNQHVIVFNPSYSYAYVYSLRSGLWGAQQNVFTGKVDNYPATFGLKPQDGYNYVIDLDVDPNDIVVGNGGDLTRMVAKPNFFCTRPLNFDSPHVFKSVSQLILRGQFRKADVGIALYGSNNLYDWYAVNSSRKAELNMRPGSPYKYYRLAGVSRLPYGKSISGFDAEVTERWQNKLR